MVLPLLSGTDAPPALRRPTFAVSFGEGGGDDGGLGGLASAVGSALGVDLGGADDPWQRSLVALTLTAGLAPTVDAIEIDLAAGVHAPAVAVGEAGSVSLGYADGENTPVFTGRIDTVRRRVAGPLRIAAGNGATALARLRLNQSYEQRSAGEIVRDLAGRAEVETGTVEDGVKLAFFSVDDRRSVYTHIAELARRSGYLAYVGPDGKLVFAPFAPGDPVQTFRYGNDILALEVTEAAAESGAVTTIGEGAAGSQGKDAWSWLIKDPSPVTGSGGEGPPERLVVDRSLRSADAVNTAARGMAAAAGRRRLTGRIVVPGAPAVSVGSTIEIADAPDGVMNGRYLVHALRHRLGKHEGFRTEILLAGADAGGGGGLLGALGGLL